MVPTSVSLNDIERRTIALILRYFTEFDSFAGRLRHSGGKKASQGQVDKGQGHRTFAGDWRRHTDRHVAHRRPSSCFSLCVLS